MSKVKASSVEELTDEILKSVECTQTYVPNEKVVKIYHVGACGNRLGYTDDSGVIVCPQVRQVCTFCKRIVGKWGAMNKISFKRGICRADEYHAYICRICLIDFIGKLTLEKEKDPDYVRGG